MSNFIDKIKKLIGLNSPEQGAGTTTEMLLKVNSPETQQSSGAILGLGVKDSTGRGTTLEDAEAGDDAVIPLPGTQRPALFDVVGTDQREVIKPKCYQNAVYNEPDGSQRHVRIPNSPWRAMCYLEVDFPSGKYRGTGWFIGPRTIMTAGHNLFWRRDLNNGRGEEEVKSIDVIAASTENNVPFKPVRAMSFDYASRWQSENDLANATQYDYGVIFLGSDWLGNELGYFFPFQALAKKYWDPEKIGVINVAGYPKDRGKLLVRAHDDRFGTHATINDIVIHGVDTEEGESGGPIYHYNESTDKFTVIGIHTDGFGLFSNNRNAGVRISSELENLMKDWKDNPPSGGGTS